MCLNEVFYSLNKNGSLVTIMENRGRACARHLCECKHLSQIVGRCVVYLGEEVGKGMVPSF